MDASKALQALISGNAGELLQALDTDEITVVDFPGHPGQEITLARVGLNVMSVQGPLVQGGTAPTVEDARECYQGLVDLAREFVTEHDCGSDPTDASNPLLADLGALLDADTITGGMF